MCSVRNTTLCASARLHFSTEHVSWGTRTFGRSYLENLTPNFHLNHSALSHCRLALDVEGTSITERGSEMEEEYVDLGKQETKLTPVCPLTPPQKLASMIETWISLVRNGACVLKSLLPKEHAVMKPFMSFPLAFLAGGATASSQLERFTGLEGFIGVLQLAGAGFNLLKGAKGLCGGLVSAEYIVRWRNALAEYDLSGEGKRREVDMLSDVLARQDDSNNRRIIQGICQIVIGTGLVVLACFSWKLIGITTTATAVAILEVALGTLLVIAVAGVWKMWAVTEKVEGLEQPTASDVDVVEFLAPLATVDASWEPDVRIPPTVDNLRNHMRGMSSVGKVVSETHLEDYKRLAQVAKKQAMLDAFLIFLNFAAFFGYGTIPLDVFFPERVFLVSLLPPGTTAWWGNFIGDVAWTIEPAAMFLAPFILLRNRQAKGTVGNLKSE